MQDGSPDFGVRHVHPGCQPPSDEGCCRDARSPGPRLTQGEVQTTPKASVTPHQQQPPTQQPQPRRHTTLPRLRPRTWTWITPNAYLPRVCFGRRPAVRCKPHKSGRRPRGRGPWHCRRPSVVTEGYIRLPPLPPTGSARFSPTIIVVIYSVFCVWCSKNIVFYRVLWPSPSPGFILATLKNHGFFIVLGLRKGFGTENWTSSRPWCQHRANIGQDVGYMGQHKAKIGASLRQHRANIGQDVGHMGRHKGYMGQHKAKIGASLRQHRANIGQDVGYMGRHKAKIGTT